jgi:hypothetical protein
VTAPPPRRRPTYDLVYVTLIERDATVRLGRNGDSWTFDVVVPPAAFEGLWRRAAFVFPDPDELDAHARLVSEWLATFS